MPNIQLDQGGTYLCVASEYPPNTPGAQVSASLRVLKSKFKIIVYPSQNLKDGYFTFEQFVNYFLTIQKQFHSFLIVDYFLITQKSVIITFQAENTGFAYFGPHSPLSTHYLNGSLISGV